MRCNLVSVGIYVHTHYSGLLQLQVIVPLLVTEDEKTLVSCVNCLTKVLLLEFFFCGNMILGCSVFSFSGLLMKIKILFLIDITYLLKVLLVWLSSYL